MKRINLRLTLDNAENVAEEFLQLTGGNRKFAFFGSMGAGKTTFITELCHKLRAIDLVSSPTFSIVNEYETESGEIIYHFDFYRINKSDELYDIGFEEYCLGESWCFVEWPEKAESHLTADFIPVTIHIVNSVERELQINIPE